MAEAGVHIALPAGQDANDWSDALMMAGLEAEGGCSRSRGGRVCRFLSMRALTSHDGISLQAATVGLLLCAGHTLRPSPSASTRGADRLEGIESPVENASLHGGVRRQRGAIEGGPSGDVSHIRRTPLLDVAPGRRRRHAA